MERQGKIATIGTKGRNSFGDQVRSAGELINGSGEHVLVRDWANSCDERANQQSGVELAPDIIEKGIENIKKNAELIQRSPGIKCLPKFKNDSAVLIGAGGSLRDYLELLPTVSMLGTTIATNRALRAFIGSEQFLDYAFLIDSKLDIITGEEWWSYFDAKAVNSISSFNVHSSCTNFANTYFFAQGAGFVAEWRQEAIRNWIAPDNYSYLDSGFCGLYPMLHLCHRMQVKKVYLIGHDFSFVNNLKYFDRHFNLKEESARFNNPEFGMIIRDDINGNLIVTQRFLEMQARAIICAIKNMVESGIEFYNMSEGGILYDDCIRRMSKNELQ